MSREQWGNGYWKGRRDEQKNPEGHRYIGLYNSEDDPFLNMVGQIHEKRQNTLVVEWIDYFDVLLCICFGCEPSWEDVVLENFEELKLNDLERNYKLFYSWPTVAGEMVKAEKAMATRRRNNGNQ